MDLLPSDEQNQIIDTVRNVLADHAPVSRFRDAKRQIGNDDARLWPRLANLGLLGISLPADVGGTGLGSADEALLYREFGRSLLSPSILGVMLGARLAWRAGEMELCEALLSGKTRVGLGNLRGPASIGRSCSGEFQLIEGNADWIFLFAEEGAALLPRDAFKDFETVPSTDSLLRLERGSLASTSAKVWVSSATDSAYLRAILFLGAYAVGMSEAARDMAVQYALLREQFGQLIGSFQAIKHKCSDMAIRSEAAYCQMLFASQVLDMDGPDATFQAVACKIVATDAAKKNAAQNIQIHGAIGFTAEIDAHLYVKRTHVIDALGGDLRRQRALLLKEPTPA